MISFDHNIIGFDITMNDVELMETLETIDELHEYIPGIIFRKALLQVYHFLQRSLLTEFHNYEYCTTVFEIVDEAHNVWVLSQRFHYFDLSFDQLFYSLIGEQRRRNSFYSDRGII